MDRPAIAPIQSNQDQHDSSDEPHAKRQAQLLTWTNRRTRVTQACDRCRERKRQCDYLLPRCGRCQKVNKDCTFLAVQKTRGRPLGSSNSNTNKGTLIPSSQSADNSSSSNRSRRRSSDTTVNMTQGLRPDINDRWDMQGPLSSSTTRTEGTAGLPASNRNEGRVNITSASAPALHSLHLSAPRRDNLLPTPSSSTPALSFLGKSRSFSSLTITTIPGTAEMAVAASTAKSTAPSSSTTPAVPNAYSKEVVDHLLGLFFEHCFHYFNFFDPLAFLSEYDQGIADPCFVDAMCALAARFSTHPAVLASPPYLSGEPFAVRVRAALSRQVISDVTMSYLHTALLLSFYEYSSGRSLQGYHFGGMACRMVPELKLHEFPSRIHRDDEDGSQYSEEDDEEHDYRGYNTDAGAPSSFHQVSSLSSEETRMINQVKSRTFFFIVLIDIVAAVLAGLPPAIDAARYDLPQPPDGRRDWWTRTDRRRSGTNTGTMSSVSTTPKPGLAPTIPTSFPSTTFSNVNPRFVPGASRISPSSPPPAAQHSSPLPTYSASLPWHSVSPLSPSLPPSPLLHSHFYPTPTPPTPSSLRPLSFYSLTTTTTTKATITTTTTTTAATTSPPPPRINDGPLLQSAFSQSILRLLSRPQLLLGREPLEHYRTFVPVTAAVMKVTNHGCTSETDRTMILTATSSSSSSTSSNLHINVDYLQSISSSPSSTSGKPSSNPSSATNISSSERGATTLSYLHNTYQELSHHHPHPPLPPPLRNPKRRRANPIFTSRERKIEFEQADESLLRWAEQLPEDYRPANAIASFQQLELNSFNLSIFYYLMVMILHRPILMNANLAANRSFQGGGGGGGSGSRSGDGRVRVLTVVTTTAGGATAAMESGDDDMMSRTQSEEVEDEMVDDEEEGEDTRDEMEMESQMEDDNKDNVRKKQKGGGGENERDKNDYDSEDAEDLQIIERSTQRCIEAAHAVIAIVRNFDDTLAKYHGGQHTFTVYLAGTILIMQLSNTEDPVVQSEIHEGLDICFRFFSILSPYWKETDEKAKVLRDLLSSHVNKNKQKGSDINEEDEDDQDHEDGDDDDDEGNNESGGGGVEGDEGGDYSPGDDGGAEQSLHDLIIADALLDLSNRPPREDYGWRRAASRSMPTSSRTAEAVASAFSLPSISPPSRLPPPLRLSRSGSSLSEYRRLGSGSQLLAPTTAATASQRRTTVPQYPPLPSASLQHTAIPSNHFATTPNYTINSAITTTTTTTITTTTTSTTTDPTATTPIRFVDRVSRGQEEEVSVAGEGGERSHAVSTGVSTFLKMDKTRALPPPPPPATSLHHHNNHSHRQTTTWVGGGVYPEYNNLDEATLISLEKLCLSVEPPY